MPDAVGIDFAITDPSLVGHGLGTRMLWRFTCDVVWMDYNTTTVVSVDGRAEQVCTLDLTRLFG